MRAKYRGTCPGCADPIEPGQDIICVAKRWMHEPCRPPAQRQTVPIGRTGTHRPEHDQEFAWPPWESGPDPLLAWLSTEPTQLAS